jgi:hypothetical protein
MNDTLKNALKGTFELALFFKHGISRFPEDKRSALYSFLLPVFLLLIWVYPLKLVPTEILGQRGYFELVTIHLLILALFAAVFYLMLWLFVKYLGKTEKYWHLLIMNNFIGLISFTFIIPLEILVLLGFHSWEDIFGALIIILCYELSIAGFVIVKTLNVPWQLGASFALLGLFVHDVSQQTIYSLLGI